MSLQPVVTQITLYTPPISRELIALDLIQSNEFQALDLRKEAKEFHAVYLGHRLGVFMSMYVLHVHYMCYTNTECQRGSAEIPSKIEGPVSAHAGILDACRRFDLHDNAGGAHGERGLAHSNRCQ